MYSKETGFPNIVYFFKDILPSRIRELITAPFNNLNMLWILIPLVLTLLLTEFYFGRYKKEDMGWNSAFGNSLVLIFVALDLLRFLNTHNKFLFDFSIVSLEAVIPLIIGIAGLILVFIDFFHFIPEKIAYILSSPLNINLTAYIGIIIIYSQIPFDIATLFAAIIVYMILLLIFKLIYFIIPEYNPPVNRIFKV